VEYCPACGDRDLTIRQREHSDTQADPFGFPEVSLIKCASCRNVWWERN